MLALAFIPDSGFAKQDTSMDKKAKELILDLIRDMESIASKLDKNPSDDTSGRVSRALKRTATRLRSLISAIESVRQE
jgi:hypothetical protein